MVKSEVGFAVLDAHLWTQPCSNKATLNGQQSGP